MLNIYFLNKLHVKHVFLLLLISSYYTNFIYAQTDSIVTYIGGAKELPCPKQGFKEIYTNIQHEFPDSLLNSYNKNFNLIFRVLIKCSGKVDSVKIVKSSNENLIDNLIISGIAKTKFIYPDTSYGYPLQQWINIPISTKKIVRKKSFWERLKF